jgi:hypothetical protein
VKFWWSWWLSKCRVKLLKWSVTIDLNRFAFASLVVFSSCVCGSVWDSQGHCTVCVCVLCWGKKIFLNSIQLYERPRVVLFLFVGGLAHFFPFIWTTTCLTISKEPKRHLDHRVRLAIFICVFTILCFIIHLLFNKSFPIVKTFSFAPVQLLTARLCTQCQCWILLAAWGYWRAHDSASARKNRKKVIFYSLRSLIYQDLIDDKASSNCHFKSKGTCWQYVGI